MPILHTDGGNFPIDIPPICVGWTKLPGIMQTWETEVDESYDYLSLLSSSIVHTTTVKRNHVNSRASLRFERGKDKNRERPRGLAFS